MTIATGTFHNDGFDEAPLGGADDRPRVTQATLTQRFEGDLAGSAIWATVMCHADDGTATYVGMIRFAGRLGERSGSFVATANGSFDGSMARSTWAVVPGSGRDGFAGLSGNGRTQAPHGPDGTYTLQLELA